MAPPCLVIIGHQGFPRNPEKALELTIHGQLVFRLEGKGSVDIDSIKGCGKLCGSWLDTRYQTSSQHNMDRVLRHNAVIIMNRNNIICNE